VYIDKSLKEKDIGSNDKPSSPMFQSVGLSLYEHLAGAYLAVVKLDVLVVPIKLALTFYVVIFLWGANHR
jgi:hypothetical protein